MYCIYICILMSQFEGASWLWSYGNWNYNYLYSRLSITTKVVQIYSDTTLYKNKKLTDQKSNYIRLKIKPNSVRIRFLSCQIFVLPSTGFEPTPLIHCSTIRLALRPAP